MVAEPNRYVGHYVGLYASVMEEEDKVYDDDKYLVFDGIRAGRGNRYSENASPVRMCPSEVPYDQTWGRTGAAKGFT
jgi:hypothetical protein